MATAFVTYSIYKHTNLKNGKSYDSQTKAAKMNNVSAALINLCCKGKQRLGKGYVWRYKEP